MRRPFGRYSEQVPPVFLQSWGPLLVVIHALSAVVLCGASVHQAVLATLLLLRRADGSHNVELDQLVGSRGQLLKQFIGGHGSLLLRVCLYGLCTQRLCQTDTAFGRVSPPLDSRKVGAVY
ncbi:MAG TPA: hypothetical protein PK472_15125 [Pseudomonadota bacterium]|nr:hypothetical protein [Pseudomonadota bacterium]